VTTLSQMVDELVVDTLRPDLRATIANAVNQTIRELHNHPQSGTTILYDENLLEAVLTADSDIGFTWTLPRPHLFQVLEAVYYATVGKYAKLRKPSAIHRFIGEVDGQFYYYRTGPSIAFNAYGGTGAQIQLAWYEYPRALAYQSAASRLVTWSEAAQEFTFASSVTTPEAQLAALELATNWLLARHAELVKQGVRAKVYARLGNYDRARLSYSLYESLRPGMMDAESIDRSVNYSK
jgi:hypothetical protein